MKTKSNKTTAAELRRRAEKRLPSPGPAGRRNKSETETRRLLHELRVHQVELEMQNQELREAQHSLEASRDHYAAFYDFAPVGYVTFDAKGIVREVNLTIATMVGVPRAQLIGRPFHPFVAPEDLAQFLPHLRDRPNPEERTGTEFRIVRKGHPALSVVMQSVPAGGPEAKDRLRRATITDISARKRAEEIVREERDFTEAVLDTSGALILVLDDAGRVLRFNRACEELTGYKAAEIVGQHFWDSLVPRAAVRAARSMFEDLLGAQFPNRRESQWQTKSGERRLIAWANTLLTAGGGKGKVIIASGLDITEQRRLEAEVLAILDREQQRIGLELHDDLGQQLAGVAMLCQSLKKGLASDPKLHEQAGRVALLLRQAVRQTRTISHDLAPLHLGAFDLIDTLGQLAETVSAAGTVKCILHCPVRFEIADRSVATHLYRIAQEAVNNAITHGQPGRIQIELRALNAAVRLRISDDGKGLPKSRKPGGGMGLEFMRYRANIIEGTFAIESEPGKGVTVTCTASLKEPSAP